VSVSMSSYDVPASVKGCAVLLEPPVNVCSAAEEAF